MKLACDVLSQYLPTGIYEALLASYECASFFLPFHLLRSFSFGVLNKYVLSIRAQDLPSKPPRKASSSTTNEKGAGGSKKRKAETQSSRGAQKLLKTDTSKMQKLTSFFGKKPA
jgi:ribonuclease H2 subunit B